MFPLLVLWDCGIEEQGRWEGDWQGSVAWGELLYLLSVFSWKYWPGISGENQGNGDPNSVGIRRLPWGKQL